MTSSTNTTDRRPSTSPTLAGGVWSIPYYELDNWSAMVQGLRDHGHDVWVTGQTPSVLPAERDHLPGEWGSRFVRYSRSSPVIARARHGGRKRAAGGSLGSRFLSAGAWLAFVSEEVYQAAVMASFVLPPSDGAANGIAAVTPDDAELFELPDVRDADDFELVEVGPALMPCRWIRLFEELGTEQVIATKFGIKDFANGHVALGFYNGGVPPRNIGFTPR